MEISIPPSSRDAGRAADPRAQLRLPWPARRNPRAGEHEAAMAAEAVALGLLGDDPADADRRRFASFVTLNGYVYPRAPRPQLDLGGTYNQWLHFIDDQYDDCKHVGRDLAAVRAIMARALAILASGALPERPTPFDRLTQRLHRRLAACARDEWIDRFLARVREYLLEGSLVVLERWGGGHVPTVAEYLPLRLRDSAVLTCFDVMALIHDVRLPPEDREPPQLRALRLAAAYHIILVNDIASYHKEVVEHGQVCNLVHVLMVEERLSLAAALRRVKRRADDELARFLAAEAALEREVRRTPDLARYVDGLKDWVGGNVDFSLTSPRFRWPL